MPIEDGITHQSFGWLHAPPFPPACCHGLIVKQGERCVLIDTGIGLADVRSPLERIGREQLEAAGFQLEESLTATSLLASSGIPSEAVSDIVLTHADPDHAGGLSDFPAAKVHIAAEELRALQAGCPRYCPAQFQHRPLWAAYSTNDEDWFGLPSRKLKTSIARDIRLIPLFGHTLGHCGVAISQRDSWLLHVGDAYYLRAELESSEHPVTELARLRAENDSLRVDALAALRTIHQRYGSEIELMGYHDSTELPSSVARFKP
ncbi:MBL fold metallo-hydrolase [Botrimarina hoheduenensis]|uniref:Metallo-beta-lactamase superfamily protein n=1 Tax=Botrimarina hoheduenensis TaxID=2528000 RepID=A0A5C5W9Y5_9BACT|nr:MBL fold metallo-hydrolase [Botrimarina hoheduenensis]TWT47688.1 Metallo-beta-lactamase superfamily protein [Botrimarina hoheduenensis]